LPSPKVFVETILEWSDAGNLRDFPWRRESRVWAVALAEILLARTPAKRVLPVYERMLSAFPSPEKLANADLKMLIELLKPLGLQEKKAVQLRALGSIFVEELPRGVLVEKLREVPGMGPYSYNATLLFGLGIRRPILDSNVRRVLTRYFGIGGERGRALDERLRELLEHLLPSDVDQAKKFSYGLLDFASTICKKKPSCGKCPLSSECWFARQGRKGRGD